MKQRDIKKGGFCQPELTDGRSIRDGYAFSRWNDFPDASPLREIPSERDIMPLGRKALWNFIS